MKKWLFTSVLILFVTAIVYGISYFRISDFKKNKASIAEQSVKSATSEISRTIFNLKHHIAIFAEEKRDLLLQLSEGESSDTSYQTLTQLLRKHFPDFFAVTLTSSNGDSLLTGFDSLVGNGCRRDIKKFVGQLDQHGVYMHSSPKNGPHHFDVMVPFIHSEGSEGVFFVSFKGQLLATILKSIEVSGHNLYLVRQDAKASQGMKMGISTSHHKHEADKKWKIEASSLGARDIISRNLLLSEDEITAVQAIDYPVGTQWMVIDILDEQEYLDYVKQVVLNAFIIEIAFLVLILLIYRQLTKTVMTEKKTAQEREAKKNAQRANLAKSEFLANMSHEIRTPLNGILGVTELLGDMPLTQEQHDYIKTLKHSSKSLLTIINDILDFSKIESGKLEIEYLNVNLNHELTEIEKLLLPKALEKQLKFEVDKSDDDIFILSDPVRLRQVLLNLASNAIKFTHHGVVKIKLHVSKESETGLILKFQIIDTGIGISEEKLSHVFEKFTQADSSTTREFGGTGLGLAISKQLIGLMKGEISVVSQLGKGSNFRFHLPVAPGNKFESDDGLELQHQETMSGKILLVDDNPTNRMVAKKIIEKQGIDVIVAENGLQAVEIFQTDKFDMVLMDMQMPVMDGIQATEEIVKLFPNNQTPIIAMTANAMEEHKQACLEAGMIDFMTKPINIHVLSEVLSKYLNHDTK